MSSETVQPIALQFADQRDESSTFVLVIWFVAHVLLGLLMAKVSSVATIHVLATVVIGIYFAIFDDRVERVAYVGAYIIGAEVLWRMTGAQMFWETGKYAIFVIFAISICRTGRFRGPLLPVIYLAMLIPSTIMVLVALGWDEARDSISFNLSGPAALVASAWFFWNIRLSRRQLQRLFLSLIAPVLAIAGIALYGIINDPWATYGFGKSSNFASSGGFGPNQVSSVLGLGVLLLMFFMLDEAASWKRRWLFLACILWLASQCALTFSRGGLYNVVAGVAFALPFLIKDPGTRVKVIITAAVLFILGAYVLLPGLNSFTRGNLSTRFESSDTTGRSDLFFADLQLWQEHPLLGVGPGQAGFYRQSALGSGIAAHTEFTRLVAEHGTLGFAALLVLLIAGLQRVASAHADLSRAVAAALVGWSLFSMLHAGMRLAAPSFLFGLAYAALQLRKGNFSIGFIVTGVKPGTQCRVVQHTNEPWNSNDWLLSKRDPV